MHHLSWSSNTTGTARVFFKWKSLHQLLPTHFFTNVYLVGIQYRFSKKEKW
jgi:DNA gyrase inhibitor GyrI